ncbi:PilN domain-containing protein [Syntrophobacter fumaroxidans]|uniref:Fimbrial assembly family protein n=1 Tax=Syntrophobacter fumaroxidans (strain DSM 10017 / MPOB) TaxID=335543 RepID=A0LFN5_SYNFM|nr:PilN domain-containing protein [Syntrophobacter fumaroxidans]ABK16237.1 Fimbrial assembly family protein [Syntrophobacter fumaroxidans MPOB]
MIQINLLPVRAKKKRETARQFVSIYFLSIILMAIALGAAWFLKDREIQDKKAELSRLQQEVAKYAKFEEMLKDLTKKKELVDKKRTIIRDLQQDRDTIVRVLALLSVQLPPERMWFDRLSQVGTTITLDGTAMSNEALVEFMRNLESSPYIEKGSVNLIHSRQTVIAQKKLREFQLSYRFFPFSEVKKRLATKPS